MSDARERLRVLHVVSYFPPDRVGGVGEVVFHLHHELLRAGYDSKVLTSGKSDGGSRVVRIPGGPSSFILACWRHLGLARQADIVNVHHGEALLLLLLMKLLRVQAPIVLTLHVSARGIRQALHPFAAQGHRFGRSMSGFFERAIRMRVREWLDRCAVRLADELSFISKSAAADVLSAPQAEHAHVIYNGLPVRIGSSCAAEPVELLFVGTASSRKRTQLLPFVLAEIRKMRPTCRMRVIGFLPDEDPEFLRWARALGVLEGFVFEGRLRSEELTPYYRAAQVLLVPSAYEGLPMVILEAYQNAVPSVATRVSGHPEVVEEGRSGCLVEVDRPHEMAEAALRILDDPDLGRRMGAAGQATVAHRFGVKRQAREYVKLYLVALRRARHRADR